MRISFLQLLLTVFLLNGVLAASAQELLDQRVSVRLDNYTVRQALLTLEKTAHVKFVYSRQVVQIDRKVSLAATDERLVDVLDRLLKPLQLSYVVTGSQIALVRSTTSDGMGSIQPAPKTADLTQTADQVITGKVADEKGVGLPGVSVVVKNTTRGTSTDSDGQFKLNIPDGELAATLVFSFVGYLNQEVAIGSRTRIDVKLIADQKALDEVVVIGYGTQRKKELTSAVASISQSKLADLKVSSFSEALVGQVSGVQISQVNGGPGTALNVRIRGTGSIGAGNNPLYVVDGFPLSVESLSSLNTSDIESIEVLKDASATAIYGSRGSNGVVIVTTRRGATGKTRIDFNAYTGVQNLSKKVDVLNPEEYVDLAIEAIQNAWVDRGGSTTDPNSVRPSLYQIAPYFLQPDQWTRTDWQDEIFKTAAISDYNLSASGGSEKMKYMVSGGYFDQRGILTNTGFKRYSGRLNLDGVLTNRIRFKVNFSPNYAVTDKVKGDGRWNEGAIGSALALPGIFAVRNADGTYPSYTNFGYNSSAAYNPVSLVEQARGKDNSLRLIANTNVSFDILKNLTYTLNTGIDYNSLQSSFYTSTLIPASGITPGGQFNTSFNTNWVVENTLTYTKEFTADHRFNLLLGQSAQRNHLTESSTSANNYPNDLVKTLNAGQVTSANSTESEWALASYFARLTYAYKDKYYLNAAIRRDGSSRFGENRKWGVFPSLSAGWSISEEPFLKHTTWLDELKLRASYGVTGNNFIANYGAIGLLNSANYVFGNTIVNAQVPSTFSNALLSWETSRQADLGLDLRILRGRVDLVYDYYNKVNSNLLLNVPVPSINGVTSTLQNIGRVRNQGMEWMLTTRNLVGKFAWTTSLNVSYNRNKVLALGPGGDPIISSGMSSLDGTHITQIGKPIGSFYGFVFEGVYNTAAEIAARPHLSTDKPGDPIIRDVNGDGAVTMDDRTIIGNNVPDYIFGIDNTFKYRNFDLRVFFQGVEGNQILNFSKYNIGILHGRLNQLGEARDRWRSPENPGNGKVFRADLDINGYRRLASTNNVEDASFVRLRNVTLGYTFPQNVLNRLRITQAKVFITGQNLFTWAAYSMYNPEASQAASNSALTPGSDMDVYPLARTYTIGLNLTF
jgi:TonB-linked SusC/RagA family outer membrane protein